MPFLTQALQMNRNYAKDALRLAVLELQRADIASASLDARLLLQHVLGVSREQLLADDRLVMTSQQEAHYQDLITRRIRRQPVSQLVGKREFWGMSFCVSESTLDPRPDSETLIEAVLKRVKDRSGSHRLLDLGTGTGCLLLSLLNEYPNATGLGVDICEKALAVAQQNASAPYGAGQQGKVAGIRHLDVMSAGIEKRARFLQSRWADAVEGEFDIIVSNPPYIRSGDIAALAPEVRDYEPHLALDGGVDGLDCYREIMRELPRLLAKDGIAAFEIGFGQQRDLQAIVEENGLQVAGMKEDLAGIVRCVLVHHPK
jgi:release factor glutamine methyltransferase